MDHDDPGTSRPGNAPTFEETIEARQRGYQAYSDLVTEIALRWSLTKHIHSLDAVYPSCRWCEVEGRVLAVGHMASIKPRPDWWKEFIAERRAEDPTAIPGGACVNFLRIESGDGRWWVFAAAETAPAFFQERDDRK